MGSGYEYRLKSVPGAQGSAASQAVTAKPERDQSEYHQHRHTGAGDRMHRQAAGAADAAAVVRIAAAGRWRDCHATHADVVGDAGNAGDHLGLSGFKINACQAAGHIDIGWLRIQRRPERAAGIEIGTAVLSVRFMSRLLMPGPGVARSMR